MGMFIGGSSKFLESSSGGPEGIMYTFNFGQGGVRQVKGIRPLSDRPRGEVSDSWGIFDSRVGTKTMIFQHRNPEEQPLSTFCLVMLHQEAQICEI